MTVALIYHDLAPRGQADTYGLPGPTAARYKLEPEAFEAHLDAIRATGAHVALLPEKPDASLTFDDGGASALDAASALERRGWRGHFFITTGRIDTPGFLAAAAVQELVERGHAVGSHSHTHPTYMGALDRAEIASEWRQSRDALAAIIGKPPLAAAVPGGFVSSAVIEEAARAGYELLMTSKPTTRPIDHGGMLVHGRFTIWASTTPQRAAAYARGSARARSTMWLGWQLKSAPKRVSPGAYEAVRRKWAALRGTAFNRG